MSTFAPGTLFIPDENAVNGGCLLDSNSGGIIDGAVTIVRSTEGGASLATGTFMIGDASNVGPGPYRIYDKHFALIASTANFAYSTQSAMTSDATAFFYANSSTFPAVVAKINATTGATVFTDTLPLDEIYAMAVNSTNSVLYYFDIGSGTTCHRWNLLTHTAMADLFTIPAGGSIWGRDLVIIADTSLSLVSVTADFINYNFMRFAIATGAQIQGIALGTHVSDGDVPRLSLDLGGTNQAIWMRTYPNDPITTSTFTQISLSTSAFLTTLVVPTGNTGDPPDPTKAPDSCPFFAWSDNLPPTPPGPDEDLFIGTETVVPMKRVRRIPLPILPGNANQTLGRVELQFEAGTGFADESAVAPQWMLAVSFNSGQTFGTARQMSAGREGQFYTRAYANALGTGRFPVLDLSCTDPFNSVLTDVQVTMEPQQG